MVSRLKVTLNGYMAEGAERFAIGVHYTPPTGTPTNDDLLLWAKAIETELGTRTTDDWVGAMSANTGFTSVNVLWYPETGPAARAALEPVSPIVAGTGTPQFPTQCARVFTLLTGTSSRRTRGRVYVPQQRGTILANGKVQTTANSALQFASFLADLGAAWPGVDSLSPAVYSAVGNLLTPVSGVRVGDVIDTQRGRSKKLVESFQFATV